MKPETKVYKILKKKFEEMGYCYLRLEIDTWPDIFVFKKNHFMFIEVKKFKGENFDIEKDVEKLSWQPGQQARLENINKFCPGAGILCVSDKNKKVDFYFFKYKKIKKEVFEDERRKRKICARM